MDNVIDFINVNRDRYLDELKALLAIPSISALPEHAADVRRCAEWCADEMRRIGLQNVRLIDTPGNPVVYGDWLGAPGAPTILFYGHYDVQPVDPLDALGVAAVRGDHPRRRDLRARIGRRQGPGVHALQGGRGAPETERPPAGEHEVHHRRRRGGRQRAPRRLRPRAQRRARRRCRRHFRFADVRARRAVDLLRPARPGVLPDRSARQQHRPALRFVRRRGREPGVRAGADDRADEGSRRPHQDSGLLRRCGGAADEERQAWASLPFNEKKYRKDFGIPKLHGETGYTTLERTWARPTLEVNGLLSGFTGEGAKTVLPARRDGEDQHAARARIRIPTRSRICSRPTSRRSRRRPWS